MWTNNPKQREEFLRNLIDLGVETTKVDFKRTLEFDTKEKTVELLKDISAMANSDDVEHSGYGFIVFGTQGQKIVHDVPLLTSSKRDNTSAVMRQKLREYIWPEPKFDIIGFNEDGVGSWGVIVVPPSDSQPHFFIKEFNNEKLIVKKGNWFVRKGDTTCPAEPEDYTRVLEKKIHSATEPLKEEIATLHKRVLRLETLSEMQSEPPKLDICFSGSKEKTINFRRSDLQSWWAVNIQISNRSKVAAKQIYLEIKIDEKAKLVKRPPNQKSQEDLNKYVVESLAATETGPLFIDTGKNMIEGRLSFMDNLIRPGGTEVIEKGYLLFHNKGKYTISVCVTAENLPHPHDEVLTIEVE